MSLFRCCCKPSQSHLRSAIIAVDVDGTLVASGSNELNIALLRALRGQTIVLLTNMSMREVQERALNPRYLTRVELITLLKKDYNITVSAVVIPSDLSEEMSPGQSYRTFIAPWTQKAIDGELTETTLTTHAGYLTAGGEFHRIEDTIPTSGIGTKGALLQKLLRQPLYASVTSVYFFEDREDCVTSVEAACHHLGKNCFSHRVDMHAGQTLHDYQETLLRRAPHSPHTTTSPLLGRMDPKK